MIDHYRNLQFPMPDRQAETFPSSPGCDKSEYLILIYMNSNGLHVISCEANGVLCYHEDHTGFYIKDTSRCMLPKM